jgi:hypothetical protein
LDLIRLMRKTMHSSKEERKAADVAERWRELSARPSTAAQKEVKNSERGEDIASATVEEIITCVIQ